jgi:UDP-N-acetylmuramyl pentapeptide phosphotransferase/UDP-N-acetylglucosamine-1-phosphate transferase
MGDIGSVIIGFVMALLTIHFTETTSRNADVTVFSAASAPVIALAILIIPVIDFLRIIIFRVARWRSLFKADNNHIHHRLLELGLSQTQITLLLGVINCLFIAAAFLLRNQSASWCFIFLLIAGFALSQIPFILLWMKKKKSFSSELQP